MRYIYSLNYEFAIIMSLLLLKVDLRVLHEVKTNNSIIIGVFMLI